MVAASALGFPVLAGMAAAGAGWATRRFGRPGASGTAHRWPPAAGLALIAGPLAMATPLPVPALLATAGLAAATVVDAVEGRIPTPIAHGTTAAGSTAVVIHIVTTGDVAEAAGAYLWTGALLALFALAWLLGGIGFGDVRLAPALAPGLTGGLPGVLAFTYVTLVVLAGLVLVRRRRRWDRPRAPLAPALFAGWLAALAAAAL